MDKLTHFSLFSGIGGIDLAAEWAGFETVGQCEFNDYATKVLEKNFPDVERWRDVRELTVKSFRERTGIESPTLISGGFPCQPHSVAGKRKASADERDLWGEFARVIREIRPKWVLGENVRGLLSSENGRFFGRVLRDFSDMGYNVGWCCYGASKVGAWHKRERVFIIARNTNGDYAPALKNVCGGENPKSHGICNDVSNAGRFAARSSCNGFDSEQFNCNPPKFRTKTGDEFGDGSKIFSDAQSGLPFGLPGGTQTAYARLGIGNKYPCGEYMSKYWSAEPDVGRVANGIPSRLDRLRCLGNAVVPQQVYPILKNIAEIENNI